MSSTITIIGNVTRNPELRFTGAGLATTQFSVAVNRKVPGRGDQPPTEAVSFFNVVAWNTLAENICESVSKGQRVVVTGRMDQRTWQAGESERKTTYELVAEEVGVSLRWNTATVHRPNRATPTVEQVREAVLGPVPEPTAAPFADAEEPVLVASSDPF